MELLRQKRVRDAFIEFSAWLPRQGSAQRAALSLRKHVEFFELLDEAGDVAWTSEVLLKRFGAAALRRYELPVRWLQMTTGVVLSSEDKTRDADLRRAHRTVSTMPEGTEARSVLAAFQKELERRRDAGKLTERSMRLALRPALALLMAEDPQGSRLPEQATLDRYLNEVPGQRAALSTFLGYLRSSRGVELRLPARPATGSTQARKALEKQIAALMVPPVNAAQVAKRWEPLALRYFHHLSLMDARTICKGATRRSDAPGIVLSYRGEDYWIPAEPTAQSPFVQPLPGGNRSLGARVSRSVEKS